MPNFISPEIAVETYRTLSRDITEDERRRTIEWYASAKCHATNLCKIRNWTVEQAASIIAAFSPRVQWKRNMELAYAYADGREVRCLTNSIRNAQHATGYGFDALRGLKTNSFARNIAGEMDAVTIDVWMLRPFGLKAANKTNYRTLADAIRTVGREVNMTPADLQALIWVRLRGKAE